ARAPASLKEALGWGEGSPGPVQTRPTVRSGEPQKSSIPLTGIPLSGMDDVAAALPLRDPTFLILTALASGPAHGYGILRSVEDMSGGRVRLRGGTLYRALAALRRRGLTAQA